MFEFFVTPIVPNITILKKRCLIDRCNYISENGIHYQRKFENGKFSNWKRL